MSLLINNIGLFVRKSSKTLSELSPQVLFRKSCIYPETFLKSEKGYIQESPERSITDK